jgi:hypothetical protein
MGNTVSGSTAANTWGDVKTNRYASERRRNVADANAVSAVAADGKIDIHAFRGMDVGRKSSIATRSAA